MTVEANIDELARLLAELEKRHPLDPAWPILRAQVQRMHADIEARINADIQSAIDELGNACAALEPADRHRIMSEFQKAYPGLGDLIHQPASTAG
jgi:hypothetical protein